MCSYNFQFAVISSIEFSRLGACRCSQYFLFLCCSVCWWDRFFDKNTSLWISTLSQNLFSNTFRSGVTSIQHESLYSLWLNIYSSKVSFLFSRPICYQTFVPAVFSKIRFILLQLSKRSSKQLWEKYGDFTFGIHLNIFLPMFGSFHHSPIITVVTAWWIQNLIIRLYKNARISRNTHKKQE